MMGLGRKNGLNPFFIMPLAAIPAGRAPTVEYPAPMEGQTVNVGLPTLLKFQRRQYIMRFLLRTILDRVLQEACKAQRLAADIDMQYDLVFPDIDVDDHQMLASSTQMLVSALTAAKQQGWVSDETAMRLLFQFAGEEMDIHAELARIHMTGKE
jgi:hypothetical protein